MRLPGADGDTGRNGSSYRSLSNPLSGLGQKGETVGGGTQNMSFIPH